MDGSGAEWDEGCVNQGHGVTHKPPSLTALWNQTQVMGWMDQARPDHALSTGMGRGGCLQRGYAMAAWQPNSLHSRVNVSQCNLVLCGICGTQQHTKSGIRALRQLVQMPHSFLFKKKLKLKSHWDGQAFGGVSRRFLPATQSEGSRGSEIHLHPILGWWSGKGVRSLGFTKGTGRPGMVGPRKEPPGETLWSEGTRCPWPVPFVGFLNCTRETMVKRREIRM